MQSVWEQESFYAPADIIIVGAGFTGLWSAWHLLEKDPHLNILLLESGRIPEGASSRNAGFACFGSLTELLDDVNNSGIDAMLTLAEMRYRGLSKLQQFATAATIDLEFSGGFELLDEKLFPSSSIADSIAWINGLLRKFLPAQDCFREANHLLNDYKFHGFSRLLENRFEGTLHSGKLLLSLTQRLIARGVRILHNHRVSEYKKTGSGLVVCVGEQQISCHSLLLCTNAFTDNIYGGLDIVPARGQVLLVRTEKPIVFRGGFHYNCGYYYFRELNGCLLLGGARNAAFDEEQTQFQGLNPLIQQELANFLSTRLIPGQSYRIENQWSGIMAMGSVKAPLIQAIDDRVFVAVRMSGMGVALAPVAAELVADLLL